LRNLIAKGLIPEGDVDERSIADVKADDLKGYTQCHFFAGIGGWPLALALAGWPSEREVWTGSCPCQPFSAAGKRGGASQTRAISGPPGGPLSPSDVLQSCLVNRLRVHLRGSDLCEVIWKPWAAPWQQSLSRPRARARTISATDTGLWQAMVSDDALDREKGKLNSRGEPKLSAQAITASPRATPAARDWRSDRSQRTSEEIYGTKGRPLPRQAIESLPLGTSVSTRSTPTSRDHKDGQPNPNVPVNGLLGRQVWPTPTSLAKATENYNEAGTSAGLEAIRRHALAATWRSPNLVDAKGGERVDPEMGQVQLCHQVKQATWPTPCAMEVDTPPEVVVARKKRLTESTGVHRGPALPLGAMVQPVALCQSATAKSNQDSPSMAKWPSSVAASIGSSAPTEKRGALNPEFVCWLMGYPAAWLFAAPSSKAAPRYRKNTGTAASAPSGVSETPSTRARPRRSSARTSKRVTLLQMME